MINPKNKAGKAFEILTGDELFLVAGPCVVEDEKTVFTIAETITGICSDLDIPYIFKASYRKANRSSLSSFTGIGDDSALKILKRVKQTFNIPVITDVHSVQETHIAAAYVDIIQIPAFLCRQTDLLVAAAKTGKPVCIKKGQFMSPESMHFAVEKVRQSGNQMVALIERGTSFGYTDLVVDFRSIVTMKNFQVPVIMDCTHALQQPNQSSGITGGQPVFIEALAKAAVAVGADGLFIETHPDPGNAKSDGANMLPLHKLEHLLKKLKMIKSAMLD